MSSLVFQQTVGFQMDSNCASFLVDLWNIWRWRNFIHTGAPPETKGNIVLLEHLISASLYRQWRMGQEGNGKKIRKAELLAWKLCMYSQLRGFKVVLQPNDFFCWSAFESYPTHSDFQSWLEAWPPNFLAHPYTSDRWRRILKWMDITDSLSQVRFTSWSWPLHRNWQDDLLKSVRGRKRTN